MTLKHLLVHVDSSPRTEERVELAVTLARRFGARLTGLFSESPLLGSAVVGRRSPESMARAAADARAAFEAKVDAAGVARQWWQIEGTELGEIVGWTVVSCRYADLAIFGQHEAASLAPDDLIEQVLLESGRPLLVVPAMGHYADVGKRVVVAWTGSRESARALNDALPLMQEAKAVKLVAFQHPATGGGAPAPHLDIAAHLGAHGIEAPYEREIVDEVGIVEHVLNRASDWSADLIVTGGYGSRGFPYLPRSKTTRDLLRSMTTPLLLSH